MHGQQWFLFLKGKHVYEAVYSEYHIILINDVIGRLMDIAGVSEMRISLLLQQTTVAYIEEGGTGGARALAGMVFFRN